MPPRPPDFDFSRWPHIERARLAARDMRRRIESALEDNFARLGSSDVSFVVFGSLAREEWTEHSDVDWMMLVDGQADPQHDRIEREFRELLTTLGCVPPGQTGMFGALDFSHALIHEIGGEEDTNSNITKRVSLLLEAKPIGGAEALERVVHGIIARYVDDVLVTTHLRFNEPRVPRFLLNDIVRFWRTMAVDYANKKRARATADWALRNFKLRMSRKLIFAAGLLTCFSCSTELADDWKAAGRDPGDLEAVMNRHLFDYARRTPLDIVARAAERHGGEALLGELLSAYDRFLELIGDGDSRSALRSLRLERATDENPVWARVNQICGEFEQGLVRLFYDSDAYRGLTRKYGVF